MVEIIRPHDFGLVVAPSLARPVTHDPEGAQLPQCFRRQLVEDKPGTRLALTWMNANSKRDQCGSNTGRQHSLSSA
jgi:hypothetical protein